MSNKTDNMVLVFNHPFYPNGMEYKTVRAKLKALDLHFEVETERGHMWFYYEHGISENDRQGLEHIIIGLIDIFGCN